MPVNYWVGVNRGETLEQVVAQGTDPTKQLEISWDAAVFSDKARFVAQIKLLENRILQLPWPVV